ncbi:hypothetical protein Taro_038985 [Colocasia esculenta]|uniref:Peptidase A1 domain-containing protein n=1 Tax=Colocasia esculenta TaxID=4460 RepID=A0A843WFC5_COLES|nr:hypothetical protein [Colocasia esculenta]
MAAAAPHRNATCAHVLSLSLLLVLSFCLPSTAALFNRTSWRPSSLASIELPDHLSFNAAVTASERADCHHHGGGGGEGVSELLALASGSPASGALKLHLRHRSETGDGTAARRPPKETVRESALQDLHRIQSLHRRITEKKNQNARDRLAAQHHPHHRHHRHHNDKRRQRPIGPAEKEPVGQMLAASVESGVTLGSGEYLADVFVGTPPRHFSVIMDTGSDLNWLQCQPCHACFEQHDPVYDPALSSSYRPIPCADARCHLVSSPEPPTPCNPSSGTPCPYFYWYGDKSNTTGDLALETFTVNLTGAGAAAQQHRMDGVIFGCGHWNRGLFKGAAGLLGLGRGPLSFSSQLRSLNGGGGVFSYCLVDRNSDLSVSSKLVLGEDPVLMAHPLLNFTSFVAGKDNPADTFYYVHVKGIMVGGRMLDIPAQTWELSDGAGGTIVDSGTTLSYFAEPAYQAIREAVLKEVKAYPVVEDFPVLSPCYNVSGVEGPLELPGLAVVFGDGAVWHFPPKNCFIRLEPEDVVCLAVLGTPRSSLSILGNYQQQNFHVVYDAGRSRLGFAPARCAEV